MVIVLCGVSASGKTTIGKLLAQDLGWPFFDADDFHPASNIEKMHRGFPLDDRDRAPWLARLRDLLTDDKERDAVLACSALKKDYRAQLRVRPDILFFYLQASPELIRARMAKRPHHFMPAALQQSQFLDLEEPEPAENVFTIPATLTPEEIVSAIRLHVKRE